LEGWIATDSLYIYNSETDSWRQAASMPSKRGALTAQFVDGLLYAVGGANRIALDSNESYDPQSDSWQKKASMPTSREHLASAVIDSQMYVIGGRIITLESNLASNEMYDPKTNSWETLESMPTARGGLAAAAIADTIFVFGGESPNFTFEQNEQYIPDSGWFSHESMPTARHGLGATVVDDRIYVIGGGLVPGASVSGINESYFNAAFVPEFGVLSFIVLGFSFVIVFALYFTRINKMLTLVSH
jgi:N-acetylneuraminic acid mutarotase